MNSKQIMDMLFLMDTKTDYTHSVDTFKCGDPEREVKKVAVGMFPTYDLIRRAARWGADLLIVHEPLWYNHYDSTSQIEQKPIYKAKKHLLDDSNMALCRIHDHMHHASPDMIALGEMELLGLNYTHTGNPYYAVNRFELEEQITAGELLEHIRNTLGVKFARLVGSPENKVKNISACFGTPGHLADEIDDENVDIVLAGEADEWSFCEYVRDLSDAGFGKSLIVMTHGGSERAGMVYLAGELKRQLGALGEDIECQYMECGEVYSK